MIRPTYLAIRHLLEAIPTLELVDYDFEQWANPGELGASPAAFIGFTVVATTGVGTDRYFQRAQVNFTVTVVSTATDTTDRAILDETIVDHLGIETDIFRALQNAAVRLSDITASAPAQDCVLVADITRVSVHPPAIREHLLLTQQAFTASVVDISALPQLTTVLASLCVSLRYVKALPAV